MARRKIRAEAAPTAPLTDPGAPAGEVGAPSLPAALRGWLSWHGLTQADAASVLGTSPATMSHLITRKLTGRRGQLQSLLRLLVGDGAGECLECGQHLPDPLLADRLHYLLVEAQADAAESD